MHRALFVGRDEEILSFAELLDLPETRLLLLHAKSGVGKSSFLLAGVIPYLEEECLGYGFVRKLRGGRVPDPERSVLFVRATSDLPSQLAQRLLDYCAEPITLAMRTPTGNPITVDLPGILAGCLEGTLATRLHLREAFTKYPRLFGKIMAALSDGLPYGLVLVVDQGEEVFTLAGEPQDPNRELALRLLGHAADTPGDFKLIVSLRTEYLGRLEHELDRTIEGAGSVRKYLLSDFEETRLVAAIERPTKDRAIPYTSEIPREKYQFRYEPGVAWEIAQQAIELCAGRSDRERGEPDGSVGRSDSVLPLVQIICTQLYEDARKEAKAARRPEAVIRLENLTRVGGVRGGLLKYADARVTRLIQEASIEAASGTSRRKGGCFPPFVKRILAPLLWGGRNERAFKKLCRYLFRRHPDGRTTSFPRPEKDVTNRWRGNIPLKDILSVATREDFQLLRRDLVSVAGKEEEQYLSLGHDTLAPVAEEWYRQHRDRTRLRRAGWLGSIVIVLAVLLIAFLAYTDFIRTDDKLKQVITDNTYEGNRLTAQFAADFAGWRVRRFWVSLVEASSEDTERAGSLLKGFQQKSKADLQVWADAQLRKHKPLGEHTWAVFNREGFLMARAPKPPDPFFHESYAFRDYFHGQGKDLPRDDKIRPQPLQEFHVSVSFRSDIDEKVKVAFSVPAWSTAEEGRNEREVLGVVTLTTDPERLLELTYHRQQDSSDAPYHGVMLLLDNEARVLFCSSDRNI
jgi:hypothetical protein